MYDFIANYPQTKNINISLWKDGDGEIWLENFNFEFYKLDLKKWKIHNIWNSKEYLIPTKSSIGRTSVVESGENFNEIVATVLFILHFKTEETQMDIFSGLKV